MLTAGDPYDRLDAQGVDGKQCGRKETGPEASGEGAKR